MESEGGGCEVRGTSSGEGTAVLPSEDCTCFPPTRTMMRSQEMSTRTERTRTSL